MDIKYFNRYELKYLLPQSVAKQIAQDLRNYLEPDPHSVNGGQYSVTSLYYDSPDHKAYWDKIEGLKFRRKVRIRVYGDQPVTPESNCFVEIKQRVDKVLQKRVPNTGRQAFQRRKDYWPNREKEWPQSNQRQMRP